ncbi:MAG: hypothetical protein AAFY11_01735 [Cyanobacteria bacterium J06641_5]
MKKSFESSGLLQIGNQRPNVDKLYLAKCGRTQPNLLLLAIAVRNVENARGFPYLLRG